MRLFPDLSTILSIGGFELRWYPVLIIIGGIFIYWYSSRNFKKAGYEQDIADDLFIGCTISAVVGARLWFVVFYDLQYYLSNPLKILQTWEGGLAIQGAIVGGVIFALIYAKRKHISALRLCDMIFPSMLVAQAIGRWGNFFNQEAFGRVVPESFYSGWPSFIKDVMYINGSYQEPTFFYESFGNLLGFILIIFVYKKFSKPKRGDLVYAYLMWYGLVRFIVEEFRSDSLMFMNLKMAQLTSIAFFLIGLVGMLGLFRKMFKRKPIILFDFDQTLADTEGVILATYESLFKKYLPDYDLTLEDKISLLGPTLKQTFEKYPFKEDISDLIKEYRELNFKLHKDYIKPLPNAVELLSQLKAEGYKLGIVSNKFTDGIDLGLDLTGMSPYIDVVIGLDKVTDPKPNPEGIRKAIIALDGKYDNCIYVGDNYNDMLAGINAGSFTIGYYQSEERKSNMLMANPNRVIDNLLDIITILKEDISWTKDMS
ncbi:MAG: prolipoprotein diacylglyceryl transferase [Erysipelotrichaceae bacterium]|nr:prolipoprotein diacylglyceryl transferase [Erysipelotrichaceae bacterium]